MTNPVVDAVAVTQADREAAAEFADCIFCAPEFLEQAFARHRQSADAALVEALERILPSALCGESWNLPDAETVQIVTTFGAIKQARSALTRGERT